MFTPSTQSQTFMRAGQLGPGTQSDEEEQGITAGIASLKESRGNRDKVARHISVFAAEFSSEHSLSPD